MRPNYCLTMLHVSILTALFLTLEADSEDSKCEVEVRVRRNTVYEPFLGDDLTINCTVVFCNNSPPAVSWYKLEKTTVPVNVSSSSHIKTEWKTLNHLEGISFLIFQNILTSDSGAYRCRSGLIVGHAINVSVDVRDDEHTDVTQKTVTSDVALTTVTWTTSEPESATIQDTVWLYRVVGIMAFVIIVLIIYVTSNSECKGVCCEGESRDTPDPSCQPSHHALSTIHIYENLQ